MNGGRRTFGVLVTGCDGGNSWKETETSDGNDGPFLLGLFGVCTTN